jgi:hypothetical protein
MISITYQAVVMKGCGAAHLGEFCHKQNALLLVSTVCGWSSPASIDTHAITRSDEVWVQVC